MTNLGEVRQAEKDVGGNGANQVVVGKGDEDDVGAVAVQAKPRVVAETMQAAVVIKDGLGPT